MHASVLHLVFVWKNEGVIRSLALQRRRHPLLYLRRQQLPQCLRHLLPPAQSPLDEDIPWPGELLHVHAWYGATDA